MIKGMNFPARHRLFTQPPVAHDTGRDRRENLSFMTAVTPHLTPKDAGKAFPVTVPPPYDRDRRVTQEMCKAPE